MDLMLELAQERGLQVIEDVAQAEASLEMLAEDPVLREEVFVPEQGLLVDRAGDAGERLFTGQSVLHRR